MRTRVALLACLAALSPSLASAQTAGSIAVDEVAGEQLDDQINLNECRSTDPGGTPDEITLSWALSSVPAAGSTLKVWASDSSACPPTSSIKVELEPAVANTVVRSPSAGGTWNIGADVLRKSPLNFTCDPSSSTTTVYFCVTIVTTGSETAGATGSIVLDRTVPRTPVIESVTPGDGALRVRWSAGSTGGSGTTATYTVTATGGGAEVSKSLTGLDWRLDGLTNGVTYSVTVTAYTAANNPSAASAAVTGTPAPVEDFWERYQRAGGQEPGGCGTGSASALALLALAALAPRLKRRRP